MNYSFYTDSSPPLAEGGYQSASRALSYYKILFNEAFNGALNDNNNLISANHGLG